MLEAINKFVPTNDRVQVSVEDWLKPVVGGYLEKRRGDVARLRNALDRGRRLTLVSVDSNFCAAFPARSVVRYA